MCNELGVYLLPRTTCNAAVLSLPSCLGGLRWIYEQLALSCRDSGAISVRTIYKQKSDFGFGVYHESVCHVRVHVHVHVARD